MVISNVHIKNDTFMPKRSTFDVYFFLVTHVQLYFKGSEVEHWTDYKITMNYPKVYILYVLTENLQHLRLNKW